MFYCSKKALNEMHYLEDRDVFYKAPSIILMYNLV